MAPFSACEISSRIAEHWQLAAEYSQNVRLWKAPLIGEGHAVLGRRMPDLDLVVDGQKLRLFTLLHGARGVLLHFGKRGGIDITPWADRLQRVDADFDGDLQLPAIGAVPAPSAVLVRPDGHVAWVGDGSQRGLADALKRWFGPGGA